MHVHARTPTPNYTADSLSRKEGVSGSPAGLYPWSVLESGPCCVVSVDQLRALSLSPLYYSLWHSHSRSLSLRKLHQTNTVLARVGERRRNPKFGADAGVKPSTTLRDVWRFSPRQRWLMPAAVYTTRFCLPSRLFALISQICRGTSELAAESWALKATLHF